MAALAVGLALAVLYVPSASGSEVRHLKTAFRHLPPVMNLCCYLARAADENHGNIGLPLTDRDAQSLLFGPVREIVSELGKRLGLSFEWHVRSFSKSLEELASGELDVLPYLFVTKERGEYLWFAGPLEAEDRAVMAEGPTVPGERVGVLLAELSDRGLTNMCDDRVGREEGGYASEAVIIEGRLD